MPVQSCLPERHSKMDLRLAQYCMAETAQQLDAIAFLAQLYVFTFIRRAHGRAVGDDEKFLQILQRLRTSAMHVHVHGTQ